MKQKHEARASRIGGGFFFSLATKEINTEPGCTSNLPVSLAFPLRLSHLCLSKVALASLCCKVYLIWRVY